MVLLYKLHPTAVPETRTGVAEMILQRVLIRPRGAVGYYPAFRVVNGFYRRTVVLDTANVVLLWYRRNPRHAFGALYRRNPFGENVNSAAKGFRGYFCRERPATTKAWTSRVRTITPFACCLSEWLPGRR